MRRDSSTVVAAVGEVSPSLLADVGRSANVAAVGGGGADLDAVAQTLRKAARKPAPYVLVTADPLAGIAAGWQAMWNLATGDAVPFEASAADLLVAWRAGQVELPDYYV